MENMRDISWKVETLRTAVASGTVKMAPESVVKIREGRGPKKDVLATARAAAFLAVKNTAQVIPHCHPIPVDHVLVEYGFTEETVKIEVTVKSIYKTGCEMEALHGLSIAALTIYDMLKPVDGTIEILNLKLDKKKGGKSDFTKKIPEDFKTALLVISDSVVTGKKEDKAGALIREKLEGFEVPVSSYEIIGNDKEQIRSKAESLCREGADLLVTCGGTALSAGDNTPEAFEGFFDKEIPGVMEAARSHGQKRTPYSMFSRSFAGLKGKTLVLAFPGSSKGAEETVDALFPYILHLYKMLR